MIGIYSGMKNVFFYSNEIFCFSSSLNRHCLPERLLRGEEVSYRLEEKQKTK